MLVNLHPNHTTLIFNIFTILEQKAKSNGILCHISGIINPADALTNSLDPILRFRHVRRLMGDYGAPWANVSPDKDQSSTSKFSVPYIFLLLNLHNGGVSQCIYSSCIVGLYCGTTSLLVRNYFMGYTSASTALIQTG